MHRTVTIGLVGALVAAIVAISSAAAGTNPTAAGHARLDTSSRAAIYKYLRSQGLDPRKVVIQRGARVYAGPHCPGKRWTCTTATRVFQAGTVAKAECTGNPVVTGPSDPPNQSCSFSQAASVNSATCKLSITTDDPGPITQSCTITQTGTQNSAVVQETINQTNSSGGSASQNASVDQTGGTRNSSAVSQSINQSATSSVVTTQQEEAAQNVTVAQRGTDSLTPVDNSSTVGQTQSLKAGASPGTGAVAQGQNIANDGPDTEANVTQDSGGGVNNSGLNQAETLAVSATTTGAVTQTQGSPAGGVDGHVHQHSLAPGYSLGTASQTKSYTASASSNASSVSQTQTDPSICCSDQTGNPDKDSEKTTQKTTLKASSGFDADQTLLQLLNCDSDNPVGCSGKEDASVNGMSSKNECNTSPCHIGQFCFSGEGGCVPVPCEQFTEETSCPLPPEPCFPFCEDLGSPSGASATWGAPASNSRLN